MIPITASMLYDFVACPHRVSMDLFADSRERDEVGPLVQLLWDRGFAHEQAVMAALKMPFVDLSTVGGDEKERLTLEAMDRGDSPRRIRDKHLAISFGSVRHDSPHPPVHIIQGKEKPASGSST